MESKKGIHEVVNQFPEGSKNRNFLEQLLKKLGPDFLKESVRKELNESHADLSESVKKYFKQHIIYTSAQKAANCSQLQQNATASDNIELFHLHLLKKYVQDDKSCEKLKLFETSQTFLTKILESKQKSKSVELFSKLVEDNIKEFCIQFSEYVLETKCHLHEWEKHFDSAVNLLSQRVDDLDSSVVESNAFSTKLQELLTLYYKELAEGIQILNKLLELFQEKLYSQLVLSEEVSKEIELLDVKFKWFELEILVSTYSESAVKALTIIQGELNEKINQSSTTINTLNHQLEGFQVLGPSYDQLAEKYQQLVEDCEKQKSSVDHLKAELALKEKAN